MNQADLIVCIGARFDDRVTGRLDAFSPELEEDPHRYRPLVDQQDRPRRPADRRRCRPRARGHDPQLWKARQHPQARPRPNGGRGSTAGARSSCLDFPASTDRDHAAARGPRAVRGDHATATRSSPPRSASTRCGPRSISASRRPNKWLTSRRARHDGLWPARRDRRAARQSRRAGDRHRRRSLDPDEHPGAGHRQRSTACRSRSSSSTTNIWAWSASGRS